MGVEGKNGTTTIKIKDNNGVFTEVKGFEKLDIKFNTNDENWQPFDYNSVSSLLSGKEEIVMSCTCKMSKEMSMTLQMLSFIKLLENQIKDKKPINYSKIYEKIGDYDAYLLFRELNEEVLEQIQQSKIKDFLEKLNELTEEYGMVISNGNEFIRNQVSGSPIGEYIYDYDKDKYILNERNTRL